MALLLWLCSSVLPCAWPCPVLCAGKMDKHPTDREELAHRVFRLLNPDVMLPDTSDEVVIALYADLGRKQQRQCHLLAARRNHTPPLTCSPPHPRTDTVLK